MKIPVRLIGLGLICLLFLVQASGCSTRPPAVPREHTWLLPWGAVDPRTGQTVGIPGPVQLQGAGVLPSDMDADGRVDYSLLVLSGGGAKGAYGAGVLAGWSATGTRPEFTIVTGVSTGALMATWAFLGEDHDPVLERFYTGTSDEDIFRRRRLLPSPFRDSLLDTSPLRETLASLVDAQLLRHAQQNVLLGLRDAAAGKGRLHQDLHEHQPQILPDHRVLREFAQRLFQAEVRLFAPVEQPYCPLAVVPGDLHAGHQRLDHAVT